MNIVILSYTFSPAVGGIETVSSILATELAERGHQLTVITRTPGNGLERDCQFRVIRRPGWLRLIRWISWAHVVLQSNVSLRLSWPLHLYLRKKPYMLVHHTPIASPDGRVTPRQKLKRLMVRRAECFSVSKYLAGTVDSPSRVLPNPYASEVFVRRPDIERTKELLFAGRLAYAKGVDTLLNALAILRDESGRRPQLTIAGSGPEETALKGLAARLRLDDQVNFVSSKSHNELAEIMNEHMVVVIPSRPHPPEAFGIVAIEAIACGCVVLASNCGGLREAVGICGLLFESENPADLAGRLSRLLGDPALRERLTSQAHRHVAQFERTRVVDTYEHHLAEVARSAEPSLRSA